MSKRDFKPVVEACEARLAMAHDPGIIFDHGGYWPYILPQIPPYNPIRPDGSYRPSTALPPVRPGWDYQIRVWIGDHTGYMPPAIPDVHITPELWHRLHDAGELPIPGL